MISTVYLLILNLFLASIIFLILKQVLRLLQLYYQIGQAKSSMNTNGFNIDQSLILSNLYIRRKKQFDAYQNILQLISSNILFTQLQKDEMLSLYDYLENSMRINTK